MTKSFWRTAASLALPIALQNLLTSCASLIDTAMITSLGNTAVAAVGVAGRFTFFLNVTAFGFSSGAATLISQYWGAGDKKGIRRAFGVAMTACMIFALLSTMLLFFAPGFCISLFGPEPDVAEAAVQYLRILALAVPLLMFSQVGCAALRATESVRIPLLASCLGVGVNLALNYCLIYGHFGFPEMGIRGAAIATFCSLTVQAAVALFAILFGRGVLRAPVREYFSYTRAFVMKYARTATPVLFNESAWAIGTNIYAMVLARQGTEAYAGYILFDTIQQLTFVFFVGICHACAILVGKSVGSGNREDAYRIALRFLIMTPSAGVVLGFFMALLRNPILSLYPIETEGSRAMASALLLFYSCWLCMRMIPYTSICGIFRAGGDTRIGCIYDVGILYGFGIPLVCLAGLVWKIPFLWIVMLMFAAEDIPKSFLCIRHFLSRKWIIRLTEDTAAQPEKENP